MVSRTRKGTSKDYAPQMWSGQVIEAGIRIAAYSKFVLPDNPPALSMFLLGGL